MKRQERIDQYIQGQLKGKDLENFIQDMQEDNTLAIDVKKQQVIAAGLEALGNQNLKAHLKTIRAELKQETPEQQQQPKGKVIRLLMAAAAAAALFFFCWQFFLQAPSSEQLFAQSYDTYDATFSSRDINDNGNLLQAETAYKSKNYLQAITLLEKEIQLNGVNSNLQLALGNAYLAAEKTQQAISVFTAIIDRNDPLFSDQANWYLALAHLKLNQLTQSKNYPQILANNPEADFHQKALQLLEKF